MKLLLIAVVSWVHVLLVLEAEEPISKQTLEFAVIGERLLQLDLYLPVSSERPPKLLVYVHGGAWRAGSREGMPMEALVSAGWAIASVDYRLSPEARFPAQVHDIKAAIRFLRAQGKTLGFAPEWIGIVGSSAGGHLAALVGVTSDVAELEGSVGEQDGVDSSVQAIVSFYGASNLTTILSQSTPHGLSVRVPALDLLLGGPLESEGDLAKLASPVFHVDAKDPPLMLIHGDQDPQMPINQAHELHGAYKAAGVSVRFDVVHGGAHGGALFYTVEQLKEVDAFLQGCH